jgi:hypothetical protein
LGHHQGIDFRGRLRLSLNDKFRRLLHFIRWS